MPTRAPAAGALVAPTPGMVGVQPSDAVPANPAPPGARLGRYQSLVVAAVVGLIVALTSVPALTLPLR